MSFQCRTLNAPFFFFFFFQLSDKIGLSIKDRIVCYERKLDSWVSGLIVDTCIIKLNGVCLLHSIIYNRLWVDSPLGRGLVSGNAGTEGCGIDRTNSGTSKLIDTYFCYFCVEEIVFANVPRSWSRIYWLRIYIIRATRRSWKQVDWW